MSGWVGEKIGRTWVNGMAKLPGSASEWASGIQRVCSLNVDYVIESPRMGGLEIISVVFLTDL